MEFGVSQVGRKHLIKTDGSKITKKFKVLFDVNRNIGSYSNDVITFDGNALNYKYLLIITENGASYSLQLIDTSLRHPYLTSVNAGDNTGLVSKDEITKYMVYFTYIIAVNGLTMSLNRGYSNNAFNVVPQRVYGISIAE